MSHRVLVVYGTRPEAIKMAPVVARLAQSPRLQPVVAVTGQHRAMLDQVNRLFGITPKHDLDIITSRQTLESITIKSLAGVSEVISCRTPRRRARPGRYNDLLRRGTSCVLSAGSGCPSRSRTANK